MSPGVLRERRPQRGFGVGRGAGALGEAGGELGVARLLAGELHGLRQVGAGLFGAGGLVQPGQGAQGAAAELPGGGGQGDGRTQLGARFGVVPGAGLQQPERDAGLGHGAVGGDGCGVAGGGAVVLVVVLLGEAEIELEAGVAGVGFDQGGQGGLGGLEVALLEEVFGMAQRVALGLGGGGLARIRRGLLGGEGKAEQERGEVEQARHLGLFSLRWGLVDCLEFVVAREERRFPAGMTTRKAKAKARSRFPSGNDN